MTITPEGKRLLEHREASAVELGLPVDDPLVVQYGALRMAHDLVQVRIAEGELSAVSDLCRLHDAMVQIKSLVPQKPIETTLTIVRGVMDICPKCGHTAETTKPKREPLKPPPTIDAEVLSETLTEAVPSEAAPAQQPRRDPGSIHDARLPDGTPARMAASPWRGVARLVPTCCANPIRSKKEKTRCHLSIRNYTARR